MLPLSADNDHGRGIATCGEFAENLEPVEVGHHHVEHEHIVRAPLQRLQALPAGIHDFQRILLPEPAEIEPDHVGPEFIRARW